MKLKEIIEDTIEFIELFGIDSNERKYYSNKENLDENSKKLINNGYAKWNLTTIKIQHHTLYSLKPTQRGKKLVEVGNELLFYHLLKELEIEYTKSPQNITKNQKKYQQKQQKKLV